MRNRILLSSVGLCLLAGVAAAQPAAPGAAPPTTAAPPTADLPPKSAVTRELELRFQALRAGKGLTADEAARRAVESSSQIEAKRHAITGTEASIDQVKYAFWPKLTGSANYTRLSHTYIRASEFPVPLPPQQIDGFRLFAPDIPNTYTLQARVNVPLSDYVLRLSDAVRGANLSRESAKADETAVRASVARDARAAYYQWIRIQARELIALQGLEQAKASLSDATNAFQAGLTSKADMLAAEARVKSGELIGEQARNGVAIATLQLNVMMHDTSGRQHEVGEDFLAEVPELSRLPTVAAAYREAVATRAELKSLGALSEALRSQASTERARGYPRLDASAGATYAQPNRTRFPPQENFHGNWDAGVTLSWTPTDIGGALAASDVSKAKALELEAQAKSLKDGLRMEVEQALRAAEEARFAIGVTEHGLKAADESYRVRRELYRAGRSTLSELMDAESGLTNARLQMADAHIQARIALVQLHHALGRDQKEQRASNDATTRGARQ